MTVPSTFRAVERNTIPFNGSFMVRKKALKQTAYTALFAEGGSLTLELPLISSHWEDQKAQLRP